MRISDWSSDVCSSDLKAGDPLVIADRPHPAPRRPRLRAQAGDRVIGGPACGKIDRFHPRGGREQVQVMIVQARAHRPPPRVTFGALATPLRSARPHPAPPAADAPPPAPRTPPTPGPP